MRRLLPREALGPILPMLLLSLFLVVMAFVLVATGRGLLGIGAFLAAFAVLGGAKRAR